MVVHIFLLILCRRIANVFIDSERVQKMKQLTNTIFKTAIIDYMGICLIVFLLGYILVFASLNISFFNPLKQALDDFKMTDLYFELMQGDKEKELNNDIVLVDVTKLTNRNAIAAVINDVNSCSPKVLLIDLIFERASHDPLEDDSLLQAINAGKEREILSAKLTNYNKESKSFSNLIKSFFHDYIDVKWAYSNVDQNRPGGCIRQYSLSQNLNESVSFSMAYSAACAYKGIQPDIKDVSQRLIVYEDTFLTVSCDKILENKNLLKDKLVILGALEEESDMHITPIGKLSGVKILAHSAVTFMNHKDIRSMSKVTSLMVAFIVCMICAWLGYKIRKKHTTFASYVIKLFYFVFAAVLVWIAFIAFVYFDYDVDLLYPLLGLALVEEGRTQYSSLIKLLRKHTKWEFVKKSIYYE